VVELGEERDGLKEIGAVSGGAPVFSESQLQALIWAANHYVAPLSVMLDRAAPPNLPGTSSEHTAATVPEHGHGWLDRLTADSAPGRRRPPVALIGRIPTEEWLVSLGNIIERGASAMIVTATVAEASLVHDVAKSRFGESAVLAAGDDRVLTSAWNEAQSGARIVVGTPRVATWHVSELAIGVVVEEGRRAMKDRQTPTVHVRDLLLVRSRLEGFSVVFIGPTPSLETLAAGAELIRARKRSWALVEVVDRGDDPPGAGALSERAIAALRGVTNRGGRSFVFTPRRAGEASTRCSACRALRKCPKCGSNGGRRDICPRCGASLGACSTCGNPTFESLGTVPDQLAAIVNRALGAGTAGVAPTDSPVEVGTERDLAGEGGFDLTLAADADSLMLGRDYRASEEALRVLGRLGNLVLDGSGRRMMVQTSSPQSPLIDTLRAGNPVPYLEEVLADRARDRLPPAVEMMAIELRGIDDPGEAHDSLTEAKAPTLMGPAQVEDGFRWLVQGDLTRFRPQLRNLVRKWRDQEIVVRVDADPIDL
jgi:primosomal protein N'